MNVEPKTTADLLSCRVKEMFSYDIVLLDTPELVEKWGMKLGDTVRIPRIEKVSVTPISPDSIFMVFDADGIGWRPVLHEGTWYRERAL